MRTFRSPFDASRCRSRVGMLARRMMVIVAALACSVTLAGEGNPIQHDHAQMFMTRPPTSFVASTAKPFAQLMDDAMAVMDAGMRSAPMSGDPDHDFVTMMIPHHQGAIDMAKALLLDTRDPELRNLAQGIITEQQNEIQLLQAWLARHQARAPAPAGQKPAGAAPAIHNAR